ncbi:MAG: hypothetical protein JNM55_18665 [Anaerolineales bacterium]|nr:hypothetical protein [Anaerolineales bacterium]
MTLTAKPLALIILVFLLGGIAFSSAMGWWQTESTKIPVTFSEGEFAGQANPVDIRGSYTFGDIANSFNVTPEILAQAFGITETEPASFAIKELETIYLDSGFEIGTASVRLFVAYYTGLPFDTTGQEIYMPRSATDILLAKGNLTAEQIAYLEKYTVDIGLNTESVIVSTSVPVQTSSEISEEYIVKGKTTFGELITWGVSQAVIEALINAPLPDSATTVKDYASANGLDFETLKPALQAEVDKARP